MIWRALEFVLDLFSGRKPFIWFLMGSLALYFSIADPVPLANELRLIRGEIATYDPKLNQAGDRVEQLYFQLQGSDLLYWTYESDPDLVAGRLDGTKVSVAFYVEMAGDQPRLRAGAVKTYGFALNGRQLASLEDSLAEEEFYTEFMMPLLAVIFYVVAAILWLRGRRRRA